MLTDLTHCVAGLDVKKKMWIDFGGGRDKGETPWQTANRELYEESSCLFSLDEEPELYVDREYKPGKVYRCYIAVTQLDPKWPKYFKENRREQVKPHYKEMSKIGFFRVDTVRDSFHERLNDIVMSNVVMERHKKRFAYYWHTPRISER